jgi:hypothetical protein
MFLSSLCYKARSFILTTYIRISLSLSLSFFVLSHLLSMMQSGTTNTARKQKQKEERKQNRFCLQKRRKKTYPLYRLGQAGVNPTYTLASLKKNGVTSFFFYLSLTQKCNRAYKKSEILE